MLAMLSSIMPGENAKDNAHHGDPGLSGLTEANLRELNAGVNPHRERKLSNAVISPCLLHRARLSTCTKRDRVLLSVAESVLHR